jgi:hypothetical protein
MSKKFVGLTVGVFLLAACSSGQQGPQANSFLVPTAQENVKSAPMAKNFCAGTYGISVTPCPIRLIRKTLKTGVVVTLHSQGAPIALVEPGGCTVYSGGKICYATPVTSNDAQFTMCSGTVIARGQATFTAYSRTASGQYQYIGTAYLKVINKVRGRGVAYCPSAAPLLGRNRARFWWR